MWHSPSSTSADISTPGTTVSPVDSAAASASATPSVESWSVTASALRPRSSARLTSAARARPRAGDGVGGGDDDRLDALRLLVVVVGGDGVDDLRRLHAEALEDVGADQGVRPLDLVVDRLADVVQETGRAGDVDVGADF